MSKKPPNAFAALRSPGSLAPKSQTPDVVTSPSVPASSQQVKPKPADWRSSRKQVPVYLTPATWKQLRLLSVDLETSMNALLIDGLDRLFKEHGLKSTADLG